MIGIYKFTNKINGKIYIGQSINIEQRVKQHKSDALSGRSNTLFHQAIREYGWENFDFEILEECLKEELNDREIYWIAYYDSFNMEKGYNMTLGGSVPSKINPQEIYKLWDQGLCVSDIKELLSIGHSSIQNYLSQYEHYSCFESRKRGGVKARKIAIENGNISNYSIHKIKQYDLWGNYLAEFSSLEEAEKITGIDSVVIGRVVNGHQEQGGGYQWITEGEPKDLTKIIRLKFGIIQYDLQGNEIKRYPSLISAAQAMRCDPKNISRVCKHEKNRITACGYKWEYDYSYWDGQKIKMGD